MRFSSAAGTRRAPMIAFAALALGAVLLAFTVVGVTRTGGDQEVASGGAGTAASSADPLTKAIDQAQERLRLNPERAVIWAELGAAYVEQARVTADPSYYGKAQGALDRSMQLQPEGNAEAMIGLGGLANARHDFAEARDWALQARELRPWTASGYGVLADALTQLGDVEGATAAVQRMLDLRPNVTSFARASYDLELQGRTDDARYALERALDDAIGRSNIAFSRYYLGELAFNSGDLQEASRQYERGLVAAPNDAFLRQGRAKVAAAHGDIEQALADYQTVTNRLPLPQYIQEYGELLSVAGREDEAQAQFTLYRAQQRLFEAEGATDDLALAQFDADHGDPAEALRRAEAAWNQRQMVLVADAMAWALHVNGRDAEALEFADKAAAHGWRNALFAYHRGMILKALGRDAEAEAQLVDAFAINPNFSPYHVPRAQRALSELRAAG